MSILEDYGDSLPPEEDDDPFTDHEFRDMENQILSLCDTASAIHQYGSNPTALAILKTTNLLSGTSLEAIAIEDYGFHHNNDNESKIALESILESIKEKTTKWAVKVTTFFKEKAANLGTVVKDLFGKLMGGIKASKEKVLSNASKTKDYVKVHPYKTIAMVATAAVAVLGIVSFVGKNIPSYKDADKLPGFLGKFSKMITDMIKWPFGKIIPKISKNGKKISIVIAGTVAAGGVATIGKLGWTSNGAETISSLFSKVGSGFSAIWNTILSKKDSVIDDTKALSVGLAKGVVQGARQGYKLAQPVDAPNSAVGKLASGTLGVVGGVAGGALIGYGVIVTSIFYVLYKLIKVIVIGGLRLTVSTFNRIMEGKPENTQYV